MGNRGLEFKKTGYETLISEFKRVLPTCPICGSALGYEATHRVVTYYVRCTSCGAVWQPEIQVSGPVWNTKFELVRFASWKLTKTCELILWLGKGTGGLRVIRLNSGNRLI